MTTPPSPRVAVIVVAAGAGLRLGADLPKAFVPLRGRPLLAYALDSVFGMSEPAQVVVVVPEKLVAEARSVALDIAGSAAGYLSVVAGGETRQRSVAAGLAVLLPSVQVVLVHDAARSLTPAALFDSVVAEVVRRGHGVIPGLAVSDTIKRTDADGGILGTVDRSELAAVQTPQGFPKSDLLTGYAQAADDFTDDAAVVTGAGFAVSVVAGDALAFKITTPWDLRRAEELLPEAVGSQAAQIRVGTGVDTHAFADEGELWLAGLHWPGESPLAGHSDGDAVAHAITDALLSAAGLGDIGGMFGTDDPRFDGAHGEVFLVETRAALSAAGFDIQNVSVQIVGNRPRFSSRRMEAETLLTALLGAPVSIAATTTDGLGFTGRGEGLTAIATALVSARPAG